MQEKEFNCVHWDFLKSTLQQVGLEPNLIHKILALYSSPSARLCLNGLLSDAVLITMVSVRGALSPLLYILSMEHLAIALLQNLDKNGISIGQCQYKLSLYANDL